MNRAVQLIFMISSLSKVSLLRSNINDNLRHCSCFTAQPTCSINNHQRRMRNSRAKFDSEQPLRAFARGEYNSSMKIHIRNYSRWQIIFRKSTIALRAISNFPEGKSEVVVRLGIEVPMFYLREASDYAK